MPTNSAAHTELVHAEIKMVAKDALRNIVPTCHAINTRQTQATCMLHEHPHSGRRSEQQNAGQNRNNIVHIKIAHCEI
jgi:hypothetical protein